MKNNFLYSELNFFTKSMFGRFSMLVIAFLICVNLSAQVVISESSQSGSTLERAISITSLNFDNYRTTALEYDDIQGSPYLEKEYLTGYVVLMGRKATEDIPLQFDIYSREFFYVNDKGDELVLDLKSIREIHMKGKEESYVFKRVNPRKPTQFYEVLYEGDGIHIYNNIDMNFYEGKEQGITRIEPRFSRRDNYYVFKKGEEPVKVKLKKKDILKLFSKEKKKELEDYVKSNKIKLKKAKDFKQMFDSVSAN